MQSTQRRRPRKWTGWLLGLDIVALAVVAFAWAASEAIGYSARVELGGRAFVFDTCIGEVAVWTGCVQSGVGVDWNQDGIANDQDVAPGEDPRPGTFVYDRAAAWRTEQWFLSQRRAANAGAGTGTVAGTGKGTGTVAGAGAGTSASTPTSRPATAPRRADNRSLFVGGFGYGRSGVMYFAPPLLPGAAAHVLVAPYWFALVALLIWPVRRAIAQRRADRSERWRRAGRCANCGYDLRASPERCPECGERTVTDQPSAISQTNVIEPGSSG